MFIFKTQTTPILTITKTGAAYDFDFKSGTKHDLLIIISALVDLAKTHCKISDADMERCETMKDDEGFIWGGKVGQDYEN